MRAEVELKNHGDVYNLPRVLDVYAAKEEVVLSELDSGNRLGKD